MEKPQLKTPSLDLQAFQAICNVENQRIGKIVEGINLQLPGILNACGAAFYYLDENNRFQPWFKDERQPEKAQESISIDTPIISEVVSSKEHRILDIESFGKDLKLLNMFNAQNLVICPAMIGKDVFCLVLVWKGESSEKFGDDQLKYLLNGIDKFQFIVCEVINSTYLNKQVEEFALIRDALMDLTNASTLEESLKSFIDSIEKLFDDFFGAQIFLNSFESLVFSAGKWGGKWHDKEFSTTQSGGVNNTVVKTGKMVLISDVKKAELMQGRNSSWCGSIIVAPLNSQGRTVGVINIRLNSIGEIDREKVRLVKLLADQAAIAIEQEMDHEQIRSRSIELEALLDASFAFSSTMELDEIKEIVVENAMKLSPEALNAFLFLYDGGSLDFGAAKWSGIQKNVDDYKPRKDGLTFSVAKSGQRIIIEDVSQHKLFEDSLFVKGGWEGAIVGIPLKHGERVLGVLTLAFKTPQNFNTDTISILQILSDQAALAIQNSRLHVRTTNQANTDFLTGLPNRRAFDSRLEMEFNRAKRYQKPFCLLFCDLDGMKSINDKFGHLIGDKTLQIAARIFEDNIRESDFVSRWGGDEFVILIPESLEAEALQTGKKLADLVKDHSYPWQDEDDFILTISVGVASYPEYDSKLKLIQAADEFLYSKKREE